MVIILHSILWELVLLYGVVCSKYTLRVGSLASQLPSPAPKIEHRPADYHGQWNIASQWISLFGLPFNAITYYWSLGRIRPFSPAPGFQQGSWNYHPRPQTFTQSCSSCNNDPRPRRWLPLVKGLLQSAIRREIRTHSLVEASGQKRRRGMWYLVT